MKKTYKHLSLFERQRLFQWYHYEKKSIREIGRLLGRSHSTISREIKRNMSDYYVPTYYPNPAHIDYKVRMKKRVLRGRLKNAQVKNYVIEKLKLGWTPQIISGRLKYFKEADYICHESIYQYIYLEAPELISYLPHKHKRRRKKYPKRKYKTKISQKTYISERPESVNNRTEPGHWESDSVESKGWKTALNVVVERKTRLTHVTKLSSKKALTTQHALIKRLSVYPERFINSITYDNGSENAYHLKINEKLRCESFFCQPYHSWEKGSVEQVNGLIRRYLPKGTDFNNVSAAQLMEIENALNNRPRKCLGYKTPFESYNEIAGALLT